MTRQLCIIFLVGMLSGLCGPAANGTATTHLWGPSTDIQPFKLVHITSDMYVPIERDAVGSRLPTVTNVGITVGVLPFKKLNMEIGVDHKSGLGTLDDHPLYGNAKLGIPENALANGMPSLAVGFFDLGFKQDENDFNVVYVKVARTINAGKTSLGRLSVGYFSGNDKLLPGPDGIADNSGVMLAWERTMTEWTDKLWLCAEYMGTKSAYGTLNVGAAWKFTPTVAMIGAVDFYNNRDLPSTTTIQLDIDF